jgi:VanZ family protein
MQKFLFYHLPVILYSAAVLGVSSLPNLQTPGLKFLAADKLAHFLEYALFAVLTYRSFSNLSARINSRQAFWLSLLFLALFAVLDEYVQKFTPGRDPDIMDYLTDLLGGTFVLILLRLRRKRKAARES